MDYDPFGNDPAACLLKNGRLVAYAEEERFTRIKHAKGMFPINAVNYCLTSAKISIDEIDHISLGHGRDAIKDEVPKHYAETSVKFYPIKDLNSFKWELRNILNYHPNLIKKEIQDYLHSNLDIAFIGHHYSHASSAFYYSGFADSTTITIDGSGETDSTVIWESTESGLKPVKRYKIPNSLGWFYSGMTEFLGFEPYDSEWKVMGLAPYGKYNAELEESMNHILHVNKNNEYLLDPSYIFYGKHNYGERFTDKLVSLLGSPRKNSDKIDLKKHGSIALAAQNKLEKTALMLVKSALSLTKKKNLCLAGGVALNVKMNGKVLQSNITNKLFVQPVSGDSGVALGSAIALYKQLGGKVSEKLEHLYYGPEYTNDVIEKVLIKNKMNFEKISNISQYVSELLKEGEIIGWFQNRTEVGPRALGNRSILANPSKIKYRDALNKFVKHREYWRPFGCSILEKHAEEYLENSCPSPFMILSFKVKQQKIKEIPAVVHVDGTTRPQTVNSKFNQKYYALLKSFEKETSVPTLLNTSFNLKGEPIVNHPNDAINTFKKSGMKFMAIGNFLVTK